MASNAREGCQPVRQTSSLPGPLADGSVGHVSRAEQKAQTASQQCPGTASACEGLIEQGSCDCVPRNDGVEADRGFSRMPRGNDNRHSVHRCTNTIYIRVLSVLVSTLDPKIVFTSSNKLLKTIRTSLFPFQSLNQNHTPYVISTTDVGLVLL